METLQSHFFKQIEKENMLKIFSALDKIEHDELLYSRFIAYLLNPNAHHGMGNEFLKLFVQSVLQIDNFDCENCTVKTEYDDIDLFIYNNEQAIIIENKIYTADENSSQKSDGYKGELERYYNRIKKGVNDYNIGIVKREEVFMVYLTLDGRLPSAISMGKTLRKNDIICIDYTKRIRKWLLDCILIVEEKDYLLIQSIDQHQELITNLTNDFNQTKRNQKIISENIDKAWELEKKEQFFTEKCKDLFKCVKWHTVVDFMNELEVELIKKGAEIIRQANYRAITKTTHQPDFIHSGIAIYFEYKEAYRYIANNKENGFMLGNYNYGRWSHPSEGIKDINFSNFSNEETFKMISCKERKKVIEKIIYDIEFKK